MEINNKSYKFLAGELQRTPKKYREMQNLKKIVIDREKRKIRFVLKNIKH